MEGSTDQKMNDSILWIFPKEVGPPSYSSFKARNLKISGSLPSVSHKPCVSPLGTAHNPTRKSLAGDDSTASLPQGQSRRVLASMADLPVLLLDVTEDARGPWELWAKPQLTVGRGRSIFQPEADCSWWLMVASAVAFWPSAAVTCHISILELRQRLSSASYTIWLQVTISLALLPGASPQPLGLPAGEGLLQSVHLLGCSCPGSVSKEHEEPGGAHGMVPSVRCGAGPSGSASERCHGHQRGLKLASGGT